jgi:hypothetical protein
MTGAEAAALPRLVEIELDDERADRRAALPVF